MDSGGVDGVEVSGIVTRAPRPASLAYLYVVSACAVAGTVSWRKGVYFSGALDPVVAVKALLSLVALLLAASVAFRASQRSPLGGRTVFFTAAYLVVTCIGGWAAGSALASGIVAVRVGILLMILVLLLSAYDVEEVVAAVVRTMGLTAALAIITGAGSLARGRLEGGLPPSTPNELAFQCGAVVLFLVRRVVSNRTRRWDWPAIFGLLAIIWRTGSRTGLAALMLAMVVMLFHSKILSIPLFCGLVAGVPVLGYVLLGTSAVTDLVNRGGEANVTTLSSRTIAWNAALQMNGSEWQTWFGGGLAMKHIPVSGQYWSEQLLDSTWISALVQGGFIGLALAALWTVTVTMSAFQTSRVWRPFWTGLLVFVIGRSFLESGLFDATTPFMLFVLASMMSEPVVRKTVAVDPAKADFPRTARPAPATPVDVATGGGRWQP